MATRKRRRGGNTAHQHAAAPDPSAAAIARIDAALAKADSLAAPAARPFAMVGAPGTAIYGGVVATRETNPSLMGASRWKTFAELVQNNEGGIGNYVRFLLGLVGKVDWRWRSYDDSPKAVEVAERTEEAITGGRTPWRRVVRTAASFLPNGFSTSEWAAERRRTGIIGIADIQHRPQHTIERWLRDPRTRAITGVVQRDPEGGREVTIPRKKLLYIVDDALSDSPIGVGLLRQAVKITHRLKRYEQLEAWGYETDLRGVPVVKAPLSKLREELVAGRITADDVETVLSPLEDIIENHIRSHDTGYMIDSEPHRSPDGSPSGAAAYSIELLKGEATSAEPMGKAIQRERYQLAMLFGAQVLLIEKGSLALSRQMAELAVMLVEGLLADIAEAVYSDLVLPIGALNNWPEELLPRPVPAGLLVRDPEVLAKMLVDLAAADPTGRDPAVDEVRRSQGLSDRPEPDDEAAAMLRPAPPDDEPDAGGAGGAGGGADDEVNQDDDEMDGVDDGDAPDQDDAAGEED